MRVWRKIMTGSSGAEPALIIVLLLALDSHYWQKLLHKTHKTPWIFPWNLWQKDCNQRCMHLIVNTDAQSKHGCYLRKNTWTIRLFPLIKINPIAFSSSIFFIYFLKSVMYLFVRERERELSIAMCIHVRICLLQAREQARGRDESVPAFSTVDSFS